VQSSADDTAATPALAERLETLVAWIGELDARVHTAELASGDEKTAKELRKAVEAIAKHDPKFHDKVMNHVDVLTDRVATLAGTVATATATLAGKDGEIASLRRDLAESNARIETIAASARTASPSGELDEIRRTLGQLAAQREASMPDKRLAKVEDKLELLTQRLDTVSATVSTATAGIAGREGDVAALQRRLDEDTTRLGTALAELRQTIDPALVLELRSAVESLAKHAAALQHETRSKLVSFGVDVDGVVSRLGAVDASLAGLEERARDLAALRQLVERDREGLAVVGGRLEHVDGEVTRIAAQVETLEPALAELASVQVREHSEAAALVSRFEAGSAKVEGLVRELQDALDTMPTGPDPELAAQIETVTDQLASLTAEVGTVADAGEAVRAAAAADAETARELVHELQSRVGSHEQELAELGGKLDSGSAAVDVLGRDLREALDALPIGPDPVLLGTLEAHETRLAELAATRPDPELVETVEAVADRLAVLTDEVGSLANAGDVIRTAVAEEAQRARAFVEELTARIASTEHQAETLGTRFETGSTRVEGLVRDLRDALDTMPTGPDPGLVEMLEGHAAMLETLTAHVDRIAATSAASEAASAESSERLHALVEKLGARQASTEHELAALEARSAARDRALEPLAGEGRLRVELQALELRVDHAEAAARESRDAVLAHLERLASHIESRLRQLEPEREPEPRREPEPVGPPYPRVVHEGRVVAIRSGES
jgi:hypothetical protein